MPGSLYDRILVVHLKMNKNCHSVFRQIYWNQTWDHVSTNVLQWVSSALRATVKVHCTIVSFGLKWREFIGFVTPLPECRLETEWFLVNVDCFRSMLKCILPNKLLTSVVNEALWSLQYLVVLLWAKFNDLVSNGV
jgi:hypothetical protein